MNFLIYLTKPEKLDLSQKVLVLPHICGIELDLSAQIQPAIQPGLQPFFNSYVQNSTAQPVYITPSKVNLVEASSEDRPGTKFTQKLTLQFPSNDPLRAKRISDYLKVKYIYIKLSSGMVFFFGRNDYYQNTTPKATVQSDEKHTSISYTTQSIVPMGFTNGSFDFNFPEDLPVNFFNL